MPTEETRRVKDLKTSFFVRHHLEPTRVDYFRHLRASGLPFPPLLVNQANEVLDGRHRLAVAAERGEREVPVIVQETTDQAAAITTAIRANLGGPQPMTVKDLVHAADLLTTAGDTHQDLVARLSTLLPERFVARLMEELRKARKVQRLFAAVRTLKANPKRTLKDVAEECGLTPRDLQNRLEQSAGKHATPTKIQEIIAAHKSAGGKFGALMSKLLEDFGESLVAPETIDRALTVYDHYLNASRVAWRDWVKRWAQIRQSSKKRRVGA